MVGCKKPFTDAFESLILVGHDPKQVAWWEKAYRKQVVGKGLLQATSQEVGNVTQCGWSNSLCAAYCMDCTRKHGLIW